MASTSTGRRATTWKCDVCMEAVFAKYEDALAHEKQCVKRPNMSSAGSQEQASIKVALALLESFPRESLAPHLERLERLAQGAREASRRSFVPIIDAVLTDDHLLGHILDFDGSLAFYHKHYNHIVGYENPLPHEHMQFSSYFQGTKTNVLVCKKWKSLVAGQDGWDRWKVQGKNRIKMQISIAKDAANDVSLSWTARICAMAIADDVGGLTKAFQSVSDTSYGIGAALEEQKVKDDDSDAYGFIDIDFAPVPMGHPFHRLCMWNLVEDIYEEEHMKDAFVTSIAYAAALRGSVQAIEYLESLLGLPLWNQHFDDKGHYFLGSLVASACAAPVNDCVVDSIAAIFPRKYSTRDDFRNDDMLHWRVRGGNGNHLHLAAGRGHKELVEVLIEGGMNPNRRCELINKRSFRGFDDGYGDYYDSDESSDDDNGDPRDRGVKTYPLPQDWARIRGHNEVADYLSSRSFGRGLSDGIKQGSVKCFNVERGFGFIRPQDGGKDVFVHISNIDDGEPLERDEYVEFDTTITNRGIQAVGVTRR